MQSERLRVILFDSDLKDPDPDSEPFEVDYVSLYNSGTHGPPAIVAPGRENKERVSPLAQIGDEVLFINTALVPAFTIERIRD